MAPGEDPARRLALPLLLGLVLLPGLSGCFAATPTAAVPEPSLHEALLWTDTYRDLEFVVYHVPGREPAAMALDALQQTARDVTGKHAVRLTGPHALEGDFGASERSWSTPELLELAQSLGFDPTSYGADGSARVPLFFLNGGSRSAEGDPVFGTEIDGWIFIFPDEMHAWSEGRGTLPDPEYERQQRHTVVHEFGHAVGLVDCGIPMVRPHEDPDDPCHSANPESVMAGTTNRFLDPERVLDDTWVPYAFDDDDLADIAAFRAQDPAAAGGG